MSCGCDDAKSSLSSTTDFSFGKFSVPETETTEYKGRFDSGKKPQQSCEQELLLCAEFLISVVPKLFEIVSDCKEIITRTINHSERTLKLVFTFLLFSTLFFFFFFFFFFYKSIIHLTCSPPFFFLIHQISSQNLSPDEVFSLVIYCYDARPLGCDSSENFFVQLNEALRNRVCIHHTSSSFLLSYSCLLKASDTFKFWRGYLYFINSALKKLPDFCGIVWRSATNGLVAQQYQKGTVVTWWVFSSAFQNEHTAKRFAGKDGLLFRIEAVSAKDVSLFSVFSDSEVIFPPNSELFVVQDARKMPDGFFQVDLVQKRGDYKF